MFDLTSQLRRTSVSVVSNVAEDQGRTTIGEIIPFLGMARGSGREVQTPLELSSSLECGLQSEIDAAQGQAGEVGVILNTALATIRTRLATKSKKLQ